MNKNNQTTTSPVQHKLLSRQDLFVNFINNKYGRYVPYVFSFAFAVSIIIFGIFASLFVGVEFVRFRDIQEDISEFASASLLRKTPE